MKKKVTQEEYDKIKKELDEIRLLQKEKEESEQEDEQEDEQKETTPKGTVKIENDWSVVAVPTQHEPAIKHKDAETVLDIHHTLALILNKLDHLGKALSWK